MERIKRSTHHATWHTIYYYFNSLIFTLHGYSTFCIGLIRVIYSRTGQAGLSIYLRTINKPTIAQQHTRTWLTWRRVLTIL